MWVFRTYQPDYKVMPAWTLYDRSIDAWNERLHRQGFHQYPLKKKQSNIRFFYDRSLEELRAVVAL